MFNRAPIRFASETLNALTPWEVGLNIERPDPFGAGHFINAVRVGCMASAQSW
ncbi:MAG: hypothetical protein RJB55_1646 [Verrucomicrobiota bacterium]